MTSKRIATGFGLSVTSVLLFACAEDETQHPNWPPQTEELIAAWNAHRNDIEALREMVAEGDFLAVALFGDTLDVTANDFSKVDTDDLGDIDHWTATMKGANVTGIGHIRGKFAFVVSPHSVADDRTEAINYRYGEAVLVKQCEDKYRDISCGVCDIFSEDEWSIRYIWWSGEFEKVHSENIVTIYQDTDSTLNIDEVRSMYDESRKACMRSGLEDMGYENPEDLYSIGR